MSQRTLRRVAHLTLLLLVVSALVGVIGSAAAQTKDVDRTDLRWRNPAPIACEARGIRGIRISIAITGETSRF
jgi:hypothetical protein